MRTSAILYDGTVVEVGDTISLKGRNGKVVSIGQYDPNGIYDLDVLFEDGTVRALWSRADKEIKLISKKIDLEKENKRLKEENSLLKKRIKEFEDENWRMCARTLGVDT